MAQQQKVIEILQRDTGDVSVSFEFFPPRDDKGEESLRKVLSTLQPHGPVFVDFTWGAGGTTADKTPKWCLHCINEHNYVANMHLTCTNMPSEKIHEALTFCRDNGIRNIIALRGDPPAGQQWEATDHGFKCALDLVTYIRATFGDFFCIGVAGYPEGHPERIGETGHCTDDDLRSEIEYLKQKINAGADYIITQLFYDNAKFINFLRLCKEAQLDAPILPGMLPMVSYAGLQRMVQLCKTHLPDTVKARVEELKDDKDGFKQYGIDVTSEMCVELLSHGIKHFHFYTLNQDHSTVNVLQRIQTANASSQAS